jgi:hypothetical protein
MTQKSKLCFWIDVVKNDLEKLANGDDCITLSLSKPCYSCDGTKEYANKINCKAYFK